MDFDQLKDNEWCYINFGKKELYGKKYIVSKYGDIYSNVDRQGRIGLNDPKKLYVETNKKGYKKVKIYDIYKKSHMRYIHRIVLESFTRHMTEHFLDDIDFPDYFTVDHIDKNVDNNNLYNLRWYPSESNTGEKKNSYHNWTDEYKNYICQLYFINKLSMARIAAITKRSNDTISYFLNGIVFPGYVQKWCDNHDIEYRLDNYSKNRNRDKKSEIPVFLGNVFEKN